MAVGSTKSLVTVNIAQSVKRVVKISEDNLFSGEETRDTQAFQRATGKRFRRVVVRQTKDQRFCFFKGIGITEMPPLEPCHGPRARGLVGYGEF